MARRCHLCAPTSDLSRSFIGLWSRRRHSRWGSTSPTEMCLELVRCSTIVRAKRGSPNSFPPAVGVLLWPVTPLGVWKGLQCSYTP